MYYLIQEYTVVGSSDREVGVPNGMTLVSSDLSLDVSQVYFDGSQVVPIPPKPSERVTWDGQQWIDIPERVIRPLSQDLLSNEVALAAKAKISQDSSPFIAEVLGYILARLVGNKELESAQFEVIKEMLK